MTGDHPGDRKGDRDANAAASPASTDQPFDVTVAEETVTVRLEPGTTDDADALVDAWEALARDQRTHGSRIEPAANRSTVRESIARHAVGQGLIVARCDRDGIVGFVMFHPIDGTFEEDIDRGSVSNIYVDPQYRDRGIGSRLLAAAETILRDRGAEVISLEVMAENTAARRFYERSGYEPHRVELRKRFETDKDDR